MPCRARRGADRRTLALDRIKTPQGSGVVSKGRSVTFTDAPFNKAVNLEGGVEIGGVDYSEVDILVSGSWTGKNLALLTPTSTCDDPPKGHQDEFDVTVFRVVENQACGEACVRYSGEVSTTSDNFVARKDGRFLCQKSSSNGARRPNASARGASFGAACRRSLSRCRHLWLGALSSRRSRSQSSRSRTS